jgi:hypothetical protein
VYEVILVPTTAFTVNAGEYGLPDPTAVAQITDEPDVQLIEVQMVARSASNPVGVTFVSAKLTPFKVRLLPEQEGPLIGSWKEITGASNENPLYNVPRRLYTSIVTESSPLPVDIKHFVDVSDVQDEVLQALAAIAPVGERSLLTKLSPVMVRLMPTEVARFRICA